MIMRWLCDQMCGSLGRWLRAAGYDAAIVEEPMRDEEVLEWAKKEKRRLVTRDHFFKEIDPAGNIAWYLEGEHLNEWAAQLRKHGVDWLYAPFSRCLQCNMTLEKMGVPSEEVPPDVSESWRCPSCYQVFWLGSHTERMLKQLKEWQG